jgi:hypothetical protein
MGRYAFDWEGRGGRAGASRDDPPQGSFRDPKEGWRGSPPLSEHLLKPDQPQRQAGDNDVGFGIDSRPQTLPPSQQARPKSHEPSNAGEDGGA